MIEKILLSVGTVASLSVIVILTLTNPSQAGPAGILGLFISVYVVVLVATTFGLAYVSRLVGKLPVASQAKRRSALSIKRAYYYSSILALGPVLILGMQSVNEVGLYEISLVGLLIGLGCVYVARKLP